MAETKIKKVTKSTTAVGGTTNLQWITKSQAIYDGSTGGGDDTTGGGEVAEVNGETLEFKASSNGNDIVLNSSEEATQVLTNIKQGDTVYSIPQGSGEGGTGTKLYRHNFKLKGRIADTEEEYIFNASLINKSNANITLSYLYSNVFDYFNLKCQVSIATLTITFYAGMIGHNSSGNLTSIHPTGDINRGYILEEEPYDEVIEEY